MIPKNSPSYTSKLMSSTALRWKGVPTLYVWVRCCTCSIGSNVLFPSDYLETAARMASAHSSTVRAVRGTSSPSLRSRSSRSTVVRHRQSHGPQPLHLCEDLPGRAVHNDFSVVHDHNPVASSASFMWWVMSTQ